MDIPFVEVNIEATRVQSFNPIKIKTEPQHQCLESKTEIGLIEDNKKLYELKPQFEIHPLCHIKLEQNHVEPFTEENVITEVRLEEDNKKLISSKPP